MSLDWWFGSSRYSWGQGRAGDMSQTSLRIWWKFTTRMGTPRWVCCLSQGMGNPFRALAWVIRISCKLSPGLCQSGHGYSWPLKPGLRLTRGSCSSLWTRFLKMRMVMTKYYPWGAMSWCAGHLLGNLYLLVWAIQASVTCHFKWPCWGCFQCYDL